MADPRAALDVLDLSFCKGLSALPESLGQLGALQTLNLNMCWGLSAVPESLGQLRANGCTIQGDYANVHPTINRNSSGPGSRQVVNL